MSGQKKSTTPTDRLNRPLGSLRLSVIDRCDLRCNYCMPEEHYTWLPNSNILSFDQLKLLAGAFVDAGVNKVRLTGGEPLLRPNIAELVQQLATTEGIDDLAMTTNATRLKQWAAPLRRAGLQRLTISLDSLRPERFATLTRRDRLNQVLAGIKAAAAEDFVSLKLNTVVMRGFNDDELIELIDFGRQVGGEVRFIEYMDVGGATRWSMDRVFSQADILAHIEAKCGPAIAEGPQGTSPAQHFRLADGTRFGIIASVTQPFCRGCDRSRLTADGLWYLCLYAQEAIDLGHLVRQGISPQELLERITTVWKQRNDRGAETRLQVPEREVLYQVSELKANPHREMHTRGG